MTRPIAAAALAASFILAGPAAASPRTERVVVDRFTDSYEFAVDCADFGPFSFQNLVSGRERIRVIEVSDAESGELLQTIFHMGIREVDVNSVTGKTIPLHGAVHEVWDHAANTRELDGVVWMGNAKGEGSVIHDSGQMIMTLDTHEALVVHGPHAVFFEGGIDPVVCGWLDQ